MPEIDAISTGYFAIAFQIERHFPGFIDAYVGPAELREREDAGPTVGPIDLAGRVAALGEEVARTAMSPRRRDFLNVQLRAMETVCRKLTGEPVDYFSEVRGCFDIEPELVPESRFAEAIATLDERLPGTGDVGERMAAWRAAQVVPIETAHRLVDLVLNETRRRTAAFVNLPEDEAVEIAFVSDKPWSGYNWYLGGNRSRVEINTDLPIHAHELVGLIAHEAYPGHHTEHALKDQRLFREQGFGEHGIQLINTPECVISEGIATVAESTILPGDESAEWQAAVLYPAAGLTPDLETARHVLAFTAIRRMVTTNAAILHHAQGVSEEEAIAYLRLHGLRTEREARQSFRFIADPLWRPYPFTYSAGRQLAEQWLALVPAADRLTRFSRLLEEQLTPSRLAGEIELANSDLEE